MERDTSNIFVCVVQVIINGTLEEVSQERLMGFVEDFLYMELAERRAKKKKTSVDDLAADLEKHLSLRNVKCQQLQCNSEALEPATSKGKKIAGLKKLSGVRELLKNETPIDYRSFHVNNQVAVEVSITVPAEVTKNQCERLIVKKLGREKRPVCHDELTGELIIEDISEL